MTSREEDEIIICRISFVTSAPIALMNSIGHLKDIADDESDDTSYIHQ